MKIDIEIPKNCGICDTLKTYHKFCLAMIDMHGMDYLVAKNTIVVVGDWEHTIDKNLDNNLIVVNMKGNRFKYRTHIIHDPFYCTFTTLYKFSLWYKYVDNTMLSEEVIKHSWFTHFAFHGRIRMHNIDGETYEI